MMPAYGFPDKNLTVIPYQVLNQCVFIPVATGFSSLDLLIVSPRGLP